MDATRIASVQAAAYRIPTDRPESDGTFQWEGTTLVAVHVTAAGATGFGYSYTAAAAARLIVELLAERVRGLCPCDTEHCWRELRGAIRNVGDSALGMMAVAAVDAAIWDLKGKLLGLPLVRLLGTVRERVPVYGSGGFTSYDDWQLQAQLAGWVGEGIPRVKMKIGRDAADDPRRVQLGRAAIGTGAKLFVDANGGYGRKQALRMAEVMEEQEVCWFEEPVDYHDREGLRLLRDRAPARMEISAGEYGFRTGDFLELLQGGCVDVLQADATRCGISGFIRAACLAEAHHIEVSSHCAPMLHLHLGAALPGLRHLEWFHDHVRIESLLLDGFVPQQEGTVSPDPARPGLGLELKEQDAARYAVSF